MVGGRAAAAADDVDAEVGDERVQVARHRRWL